MRFPKFSGSSFRKNGGIELHGKLAVDFFPAGLKIDADSSLLAPRELIHDDFSNMLVVLVANAL